MCLPSFTNSCDVVMGKEPRLWGCPPAAATESYNLDTTDSLEPSLASTLGGGGPEE
jgi:hypothetical protein